MTFRWSRWLVAFGLLSCFASFSTARLNERPILEVHDGNLVITSANDRNITLQTVGSSYVNVNGINILDVATTARDASQLVQRWKLGTLADMEQTLRRLTESMEGPNGLQSRVNAIEWGTGSNRSNISPGPSGNTNGGSSPGNDDFARIQIQQLFARLHQAELEIASLRRKLETDECASNPCQNGGTCEDIIDGYKCRCTEGWEGPRCNTDINECARYAGTDLGCQNGAICRNLDGTYQCECTANWHGIHCTKATNDCSNGNAFELCGHGTCVNKGGTGSGFTCICEQGWKAEGANPACIVDVDECADKHPPCSVNPMVPCINVRGSFYCGGCPQGYTGNGYYCIDIDECAINNGGCSIAPSVQCINTMGSRTCGSCPPGYQGDGVTCSYFGPCSNSNGGCHPLATCINNPGMSDRYVQCRCPPGYQGDGLGPNGCIVSMNPSDNSACSSNPCSHGSCIPNGPHDYTCRCDFGYTGRNCDSQVNPCNPNPCRNRGTCTISLRRMAICRCTADFSGPRCGIARQSCGGVITDPSGTLQFPSDGNNYQHDLSCAWLLAINSPNVLNVTFSSFNLEQSTDCKFDFLQIHDGRTAGEHMIGKYCGSNLPEGGNIISTHHALYLWFHSDRSVSRDGFTLQWNSIEPQCGSDIYADHGTISSPGSPGRYPLNRDCNWYVSVSSGKRIQFHFFTMMLEEHPTCGNDYLEIKDGPSEDSQTLGLYCNHTHPPPLITPGSEAWVHFHSDNSGQDTGFQMTFSAIEGFPGCGGVYTAASGQITSPNFGSNYEANMDCEWKIQVPIGEHIKITWTTFDLEHSRGCRFDFVEIYDGINREAPVLGKYCGTTLPAATLSNTNVLLIRFKSDWSYSSIGFKLNYIVWCNIKFTAETGVIKSPYYPNTYPASRTCFYEIIQPLGKAIRLTIQDMDIEGLDYPECYFDYLEIRDGDNENSTMLGKYCGGNSSIPNFPIMSTHNYLWLKFETDGTIHKRGFMATYETVDGRCGGILKTQSGIIQSPSENGRYRDMQDCTWIIQAPPGFAIQLNWLTFDLEYEETCYHDYVQISENLTSTSQQDLGKYCGSTIPPVQTTQSRIMTIIFHTDFSVTRAGFVASYIFIDASKVCGGHYHSVTGVITSPNYPDRYPEHKLCEWVIEAPNNHQVVLNVKKFDIEEQSGCAFDYLEIRNGGTETSPLMGKYCGTNIQPQIISFGNRIYLKFKTDHSRSGEGFNIEWDSSISGCGGTMTTATGSIFSPNYPQPYSRSAECLWKIKVSAGSTINLVIVDIDLEEDAQCALDFIEIYDGSDTRGKRVGRYCESSHPLNIASKSNIVTIRFRSDYSFSGRGFHINYNTVCDNKLQGFRGVIESPNFPNSYPDRETCRWTIEAPMGNKLNLTFSHFDMEAGDGNNCTNDYLDIKEGENNVTNKDWGKFCGSALLPPKIASSQNQVFLQFYSDPYVAHNGFRLEWVVNGCGGHLSKPQGTITSPGYPNPYPANVDCEWSIEVDYLHSINITLVDVNLEKTSTCAFDKLIIYSGADEDAPKLIETCHSNNGSTFTSTGNKLFVKFHSDFSLQSSGFKMTYKSVDIQCGGKFTTSTGVIHSTNYPNSNYPPTQNCEWFIQVPVNHLVNLTFLDFDIEDSRNCTYDYVRIYDGSSTDAPVLGTHCHNTLPPFYTSSSNELLVVMRTDSSLSAKGFKARYDTACGARIVTDDQGIISMDSTIGLHTEMVNCTWTIVAKDPEDHVTLTLTEQIHSSHIWLDECDASSLQVFEGEGTGGPSLGTWCGTKVPPPITSQGNALTIHATSLYGSLYDVKFSGTYSVLNSACGGTYTSEHGTIATPGYPNSYPRNIECVWNLKTAPGNRISLTFKDFDVIESEHCNLDYVEVREINGIGKLFGLFCGQNVDAITSANSLWIKFRSTADGTKKGFAADYSLLHGGDLSGLSGLIASPLYPKPCLLQGEYAWRITVDSASSIRITFQDFHIAQFEDMCYVSLTIYDGYDENAPELMDKCGVILPEPVRSSSNIVYIKLTTSAFTDGSWFLLNWLQVPRESVVDQVTQHGCDEIILLTGPTNNTYTINSPGWPGGYDNNLDCSWLVQSLPGWHLILTLNTLDLEETTNCVADQVKVFSGNSQSSQRDWSLIGNYCFHNSSGLIIESTDLMRVNFHSDIYINKTGFRATVRKVCGGQLYGPNGVIETNRTTSSQNYWSVSCQWNVTVRPGRTIEVKLIDLDIPDASDTACSHNYLMLKNGGSASSPVLGNGKYCGNTIPDPLETTGNQLYVQISGPRSSTRFKLTYREVGMDCGGEVVLSQAVKTWDIKTPHYPNIPSPHSECFWTILAPAGEPIMIHFIERFDLTRTDDCDREYLEIRDGGTESASLIGQYCGDVAPSSQTTTGNVMYLHFYTDVTDPKNGFHAAVSIGDRCGGIIRDRQGTLMSPNYPAAYPNNITCTWHIIGPTRHNMKLQFRDLDLPRRSYCGVVDHVDISEKIRYNETEEQIVREIGQYCGQNKPDMIESSGNTVDVTFTSDTSASNSYKGFNINFTTSYATCGGALEGSEGEFSSPGYPNVRSHLRYCEWKITVPAGYRIKLDLLDFDLAGESSLHPYSFSFPRITFFNDFELRSRIKHLRASDTDRQILSTSNKMMIWYVAGSSANRGFRARYSSIIPALCGGAMTSEQGTLISNQNSVFNMTSFYCDWKVNSPWIDSISQTLALTVSGTIGRANGPVMLGNNCRYRQSHVTVTGGKNIISYICGNITGGVTVRSPYSANTISAVRGLDRWLGAGAVNFTLNYRWNRCGGILGGPSQVISAPTNLTYPLDCTWQIKFEDNGEGIALKFKKLNLGNCDTNYILVRKGGPSSPTVEKYCGSMLKNLTSNTNQLWIEYHAEAPNNEFEIQLDTVQGGCGGLIHGRKGIISSPGFPSKYPNNAECLWVITVENGYHIGLVFVERFELETSDNCLNDFIQISHWQEDVHSGTAQWIDQPKLCGRNSPPPINSTTNTMKILFRSNGGNQADGFRAEWNVNCGATLLVSPEVKYLTSPGWPRRYNGNLFCNYTFLAPEQNFIVKFTEFQLEGGPGNCPYDNVTIIATGYGEENSVWCNRDTPPVQRTESRLEIHFKTDEYIERRGFQLAYYVDECGGEITQPTDIGSPSIGDSGTYYGRINCTWTVRAPVGKAVVLRFESFYLEPHTVCYYDYVNVYSGLTIKKEERIASLCGNLTATLPPVRSDNGTMTINFVTDATRHYDGFRAKILFTTGIADGCGGTYRLSQHPQQFKTQRGSMYESLEDCHWLIEAPSDNIIKLTITDLDLKNATSTTNRNYTRQCSGDYLEIRDGKSPFSELIDKYCGNVIPPQITSSTNTMWIRLKTDSELNGRGVTATLEVLPSPCGNTTLMIGNQTQAQVLTSPNFPNIYPAGIRCRWTLLYSERTHHWASWTIHFVQFDLRNSENCIEDKLSISDQNGQNFVSEGFGQDFIFSGTSNHHAFHWRRFRIPHETFTYCGNGSPPDFHSSAESIVVSFKSSQNQTASHTGFKLEYSKSTCNRNFTQAQGRIHHEDVTECWFTITAPIGQTISLYFNQFSVYSLHGCTDSGLQIRDGDFSSSTLAELCGMRSPNPIFSSGNKLSLHSWGKGSSSFQIYDITYTTTDKGRGCGGKLYNYMGRFTSPLYPGPYRNESQCTWEVSVPMGFIVKLTFESFDLGTRGLCETDFLEIFDVPTQGDALLSTTYCGEDNPSTYYSAQGKVLVKYTTSVNNGGSGWIIDFMAQRTE